MKLTTMTKFVSEEINKDQTDKEFYIRIRNYHDFILRPIQASMFIKCDENNEILHDSEWKKFEGKMTDLLIVLEKHKKAEQRIFFPGFEYVYAKGNEITIKNKQTGQFSYIPLEPNTYQTIEEPIIRHGYDISEYAVSLITQNTYQTL